MAIKQLSPDELHAAADELDRCLYNHDQWLDGILGALICRVQPDERDLDGEAHHKMAWYYLPSGTATALIDQPEFAELGTEHERVHRCAAHMLRTSPAGKTVPLDD